MEDPKKPKENLTPPVDTTPKVTGIGGIFFYSDNQRKRKNGIPKI